VSVFLPHVSGVQIASILHCIILSSRHVSQKQIIEHKMCVLILSTNFVQNISHSEKNSMRIYHKFA